MLQQFVNLSGKDKPEDALAYFTELLENEKQSNPSADFSALESKINSLEKILVEKDSQLKSVVEIQSNDELKKRDDRLTKCLNEFRISTDQFQAAYDAYVDVKPELVQDTKSTWNASIEVMESSNPREDLKQLTESAGSAGDGQDADDIKSSVEARIEALAKEKEITFAEAYEVFSKDEPELIDAYNKATI